MTSTRRVMRQILDPGFNDSALLLEPCDEPARAGTIPCVAPAKNFPHLHAPSPAARGSMMWVVSSTATTAVISAQSVVTAT
jgi:hypothetical protein